MRLVVLCLLVMFFLLMTYQTRNHPQIRHNTLLDRIQHPFDIRLRYRIAEVDPRFGLTVNEVQLISQQATDIWKQGTGKDYFVYDPNATLAIHLIYDQRQDESNQRRQHLGNIEQNQKIWSNKNQNLKQSKEELNRTNALLEAKKNQLNAQLSQYNQKIAMLNHNGGINPAQRDQFIQQRHQLQQQIFTLEQEINLYNQKIQQLNSHVDELNQINHQLNQSVEQFNQRFRPHLFDKGLFNGKQINIYEFESADDLRLTLAHEFGHALGLEHNQDPQALMYPLMKDQQMQNFRLSAADLALLQAR
ncbi:matrixin family metalloprotease [Acinetobacter sp. ANC 4779]|uniref:matrixin family metalloprotease n=1 Tax=Acinetobacter sp. ANC 4779 TaxID=2529848 RepID=UPI00103D536C|nr:matrixin family metalloprotease [Acinetobacter sp. ANC 4779]TCB48120.1 matrixin family metalloprotease [Acinetobacter sp. ANC 4779]